jgi:predicted SAM-dependent methyltransferase
MPSLHLGCGKRYWPGFTYHVDLADYPHITHKRDIKDLSCFENNSIDLIYCSHALPYYDRFEVVGVLKEWRRVLKSDGILRLAVSNFEAWVMAYLHTGDINVLLGPVFGRWPINGSDLVVYQKTTYDYKSLKKVLEDAGFIGVRKWNYKDYFPKDYDDFSRCFYPHIKNCETMEEYEEGVQTTLNLECVKC